MTLLVGSAEGLVVVLAVKGLGRYAELRAPAAAERFILGTLASALWAGGLRRRGGAAPRLTAGRPFGCTARTGAFRRVDLREGSAPTPNEEATP